MQRTHTQGFTLIELLVSVAIFSVVMLIAVGGLLTMTEASRKAQALKSVMNNMNFALESMSRTMRVGTNYHCGSTGSVSGTQDCPQGETYVAFEKSGGNPDTSSDQWVYCLGTVQSGGSPMCTASGNTILRSTDGGAAFVAITAEEVEIENLKFYVVGSAPGPDTVQPKVIMTIRGYTNITERTRTDFNLQTTVTQRLPDL